MGPASDKLDVIIHKHKRGAQEGGVLNNCLFPLTECVLISLRTYTKTCRMVQGTATAVRSCRKPMANGSAASKMKELRRHRPRRPRQRQSATTQPRAPA